MGKCILSRDGSGMSSRNTETSELLLAKLMTLRVTNIGCTGSNFVNANGLHDDIITRLLRI